MEIRSTFLSVITIAILQCMILQCAALDFLFLLLCSTELSELLKLLQWPGSFCDTNRSCFPSTGKPASNFSIHGLWPEFKNDSFPLFCDIKSSYNESEILDLTDRMQKNWPSLSCPNANNTRFWSHKWMKHGCSQSKLNQPHYFEATLDIKEKVDLLQILKNAGIQPDGRFDKLKRIRKAIRRAIGSKPVITCNVDMSGNSQLFEICLCVDKSGSKVIKCPKQNNGSCNASRIEFPPF